MSNSDCPLKNYTCDTCVYSSNCMPGKASHNTEQIIEMLEEILTELKKR
jgi:hypothetical protein